MIECQFIWNYNPFFAFLSVPRLPQKWFDNHSSHKSIIWCIELLSKDKGAWLKCLGGFPCCHRLQLVWKNGNQTAWTHDRAQKVETIERSMEKNMLDFVMPINLCPTAIVKLAHNRSPIYTIHIHNVFWSPILSVRATLQFVSLRDFQLRSEIKKSEAKIHTKLKANGKKTALKKWLGYMENKYEKEERNKRLIHIKIKQIYRFEFFLLAVAVDCVHDQKVCCYDESCP